jgi:coproporphyrinogen III oxidase
MEGIKEEFITHLLQQQDIICKALEQEDGTVVFTEDSWQRPGGGGGRTRIMQKGQVFEKAGVNFSEVYGVITPEMRSQLQLNGHAFFATGLSVVIHPLNPFVPTTHANFRYFELYDEKNEVVDCWFGGGADLTPYYLFDEDAVHFHRALKECCDRTDKNLYPLFKKQCDNYFVNTHRDHEARGIGGIFFDHCRPGKDKAIQYWMNFVKDCSLSFLPAYQPIVNRRKNTAYESKHKYWQEIRRGRYVEFNLVHDRGTLFGLRTNGRTESILMSLPPSVRFEYNYKPETGSEEEKLVTILKNPVDWIN